MNKVLLVTLVAVASASASAQNNDLPMVRSGSKDKAISTSTPGADYALYRRSFLGETSVILPAVPKPDGTSGRWVPGPYALWLMRNGTASTEALAQALRIGESQRFVENESGHDVPRLSSYETYQRTVVGRSVDEIIRSRPAAPRR